AEAGHAAKTMSGVVQKESWALFLCASVHHTELSSCRGVRCLGHIFRSIESLGRKGMNPGAPSLQAEGPTRGASAPRYLCHFPPLTSDAVGGEGLHGDPVRGTVHPRPRAGPAVTSWPATRRAASGSRRASAEGRDRCPSS